MSLLYFNSIGEALVARESNNRSNIVRSDIKLYIPVFSKLILPAGLVAVCAAIDCNAHNGCAKLSSFRHGNLTRPAYRIGVGVFSRFFAFACEEPILVPVYKHAAVQRFKEEGAVSGYGNGIGDT